jgi:hypothetical protein
MSIRANPTAIGLFVIGAAVLAVIGVATLASASWFGKQSTFISYFGESVNGLEVGAPVKFQGVPVGQVTNLLIQIESRDKSFQVPVQYEIDLTRLTSQAGAFSSWTTRSCCGSRSPTGSGPSCRWRAWSPASCTSSSPTARTRRRPSSSPGPRPFRRSRRPVAAGRVRHAGRQRGGRRDGILFRVNEMLEAVNMEELNRSVVASAGGRAPGRFAGDPGRDSRGCRG